MLDKNEIAAVVNKAIEGTDAFVVEIAVSKDNDVVVELDSPTGVDLDFCTEVSRQINEAFDRDLDDYSLEVGSSSLTAPFKVPCQWVKNIGNEIEIYTRDGKKIVGTLVEYSPEGFTVEVVQKVKEPGEKRPHLVNVPVKMTADDVREAAYHIDFK